jgi:hypothetical protein
VTNRTETSTETSTETKRRRLCNVTKGGPVATVKVDPAALADLDDETLASVLAAIRQAQADQAQAKPEPRERITVTDEVRVILKQLGWGLPYIDAEVQYIKPEPKTRFNTTELSPLYDEMVRIMLRVGSTGLSYSAVAKLYSPFYKEGRAAKKFPYILQQISNRAGKELKVEANRVTLA